MYSADEIDNYLLPCRIHSISGRIHSGLEAIIFVCCKHLSLLAVYTLLSPDTLYEIECIQRAIFLGGECIRRLRNGRIHSTLAGYPLLWPDTLDFRRIHSMRVYSAALKMDAGYTLSEKTKIM